MPENKKYLIEIPGQEGVAYWGEERYNANKDALLKDHPDAIIAEVGTYSAEDARDNDEYIINIPGKSGSAHWDSQRFNANRDNLLKDFPNAQIQRVRPIDYWEEQRTDLNKRLEEHNAQYGSFLSEYEDKREMERARGLMGDTMRNTPESEYILENAREYGIRNKEREALLKALHENPREQQRKQNLHDSIDEMFAALEQEGNDSYKAALNQYIAEGGNIAAPGADAVISDKAENGLYNGALRFLESAKKTLEAPSKFDSSNGFLNFMKGAGHTFGSPDFWTFGLTSIVDNLEARDAFEKIWGKFKTVDINELSAEDIEQMLTPGEKALVEAFTKKAMADAERANDLSLGYQSGMTSAESLGFMAQFILTGGVTSSAAKGATKWAAKGLARGFGNLARQGVSKGMMNAIRGAGKFALGTTRSLIDAAVRTGITTTAPKSISEQLLPNIQQNTLPEANVAILKGLGDAFIENWSESYGEILGSVFKAPMNALFPEWSKAIARTPFMQVAERAGFNGYLTEIGEEWFGNAMRTLTNVDPDALKDFATVDNQIVTMTAFLPMTLIGGGVSMGQRRAAEKDLENKTANLRYTLEKAGLNMDEIDALVDYRQSLSPQMLSDRFTPLINRIAQMPGNRALAAELFKSAGHFSNAVARYQAMEGGYQAEENNAKNELRDEMVGNMNGNRFWNTRQSNATNENGEAYEFDEVHVVTRNDGSRFFIMGQAGDQLSTIDENGAIGYTTEEELNQQFEQGIIASNRTMMLDQFLSEDMIARRREVEAKRMSEQRTTQIDEIRANNPIGTSVNLGTRVNPLAGFVVRYDPERVIIQTENQANPFVSLSYEQFAQALNTPIRVLNDEQMAAEEAALIEAERAERETEQADTPDDMTVAEESTHSAVEFEEEAAPSIIPMNEDGSVDEAKFLEEHPEEYVAWNDNNMQDGGADSREQLQMLIPVYQNMYNEAAKNWAASAANPVARRAAKASMAEWQEKIDRINSILAQYNMPTQENQPLAERTIQAELEDLHDGSLNDNEIISNIDAHIAEAQAAYDEYAKTAPVMGTDRQAYKQAKAEYEEGLKGLQQELDYWNEVKKANERYGQMMQQAEYEAMEVRRIEAIKARIAEIAQRIGAGVNVIERPEDVTEAAAKREIEEGRPPLGWYNVTTGKVDLYLPGIPSAQMAEETIMHEVVGHKGLRGLLGEDSFGGLCDAVWDYMKSSLSKREQDFWLMYPGVNGDTRKAADEYMAHIAESVDFSEDRSVWDKIIGFIKDALRKIGIGAGVNDDYIIDMLKRSYANLRDNAETAPATSEEFLEENGFEVDETNDDIRLSSRYTTTDAQEGELISAIVDVTGRSKDDAERWLQSEKSAASIVLADKQYLDYIPDDRYKAIKDNSDYPQGTVDFNNICRKRVSFTKMFTRLQRRFPNRVFTADDLADIRTIMSNDGLTVACGLCYVEDRRQMVGEVASFFIDQMQKNFEDYTYEVSAKDFAAGKMKRKKLSKDKVKKAAKYVVLIGNDTYVPSVYDLTTLEGLDKLYREHRGIWEAFQAFNSDRGQQSQNLFQGYAEYKREILDWSDAKVKKVNSLGGLRVFSYSDFEAHHLLDLIQIIIDCAARGVMIQGYTKVPEFARAVAQTGIKLNRSLIPLGDTGIVDGKLAFDPIEGIDVNDPNFLESNDNVGNILIGINDEQIRLAMADPFVHYIIPYHARQAEGIRAKLKVGNWSNYIDVQNERNISDGKRVKKGINIYTDVLNESITNDRQFVERYLEVCKEKGYIPKFDQFLNKDSEGNYIYTPGYHKFLVDFKLFDEAGNILPQKPVVAEFDDTFNMQILKDYAKGERVSAGEQMNTTYDKIVEALRLNEEEAEGEDIRFKTAITPKMDAEYMAAVESGDMETAQRMVLEAAKLAMPNTKVVDENGNPKVVYHQTNAKVYVNRETGQNWDELNWKEKMEWDERDDWEDYWEEQDFNTFSRVNARTTNEFDGFFFAPKYDEYHEYGERTIAAFVNIQNPASREDYNIDSRYSDAGRAERIRLQEAGFDGVIRMDGEEVDEYIAFEPSQIKSAEAVAYDDAGNVIPLSERFNPKNEDIRFRVLDTTNAELKEKPIKLNGMYRFKLKNAFKGVKDNGGSYPYIKVQLEEVSEDYSGEKIIYNGILEGFAVIRTPKGLITEGEKENEFFIDPKAIESELWDVLRATENYYEFKHGDAPYQRDWMNVEEVRFRMSNDNQAIFVSNAAKAVEGIKQEKATPEQWLKMIEKNGGLKAGEDKWMGLSDWLKASDKKTLTKQEVLDFINEHMIQIEEQHYSNKGVREEADRILNENYPGWEDAFSFDWDPFMDEPHSDIYNEVKAARLYNEHHEDQVETDEDGDIVNDADYNKVEEFGAELAGIWYGRGKENTVREIHGTREEYTTNGLANLHEIALTVPTIESWNESDDIHFGDAGEGRAVAWVRFGETWEQRPSPKISRKVLVIDEIQSKRHQEGREKGYSSDFENSTKLQELNAELEQKIARRKELKNYFDSREENELVRLAQIDMELDEVTNVRDYDRLVAERDEINKREENALAEFDMLANQINELEYEIRREKMSNDIKKQTAIPDAPFDKNWHELAMKRMLRYAAEEGYDVIAWTKGEQQAERYGIGNAVSRIESGNAEGFSGTKKIVDIYAPNGVLSSTLYVNEDGKVVSGDYLGQSLSDIVGKEMAVKLMADGEVVIDGDNLRIGGEGMKGFYDRMLPAFMNKYGKKWGVKVEDIDLSNLENGLTMHSVPVTEEMKQSVMEGQVMFSTRTEKEDAMEFTQQVINGCTSRYNEVAEVQVFPENEETAKRFGYTMEELKEIGGTYVKEEDIIAIFASKGRNDSLTIENIFFHESIHKLAEFYPEFKKIGEWMWDNSDIIGLQKIKNHIENGYDSEWYSEEMLTYGIAGAMSLGVADRLESVMPKELQGDYRAILNEIGYEPGKESRRTESRISESSRRGAAAMERKTDESGRSKKEEARTGELTAEERRVIGEYFPEFNKSEDVRYRISDVNTNPTEAQKKAGNFKKGHIRLDSYNITIENPKGSVRRGTDSKGNTWENTLNNDYGYIRGTEGVDGDHIDVYLSDNPTEGNIFVVDQVNTETREFDEHKVMYGFNSAEEAREAYLANFSEGWNGLGTITEVSKDEFKKWIESSHRKIKPFSEYKSIKTIEVQSEGEDMEDNLLPSTGTPTDEVVANGISLTPAQTAEVAANIFAALPEESRKKITDGLNGNILGLKDAILQMPTSLAMKSDLTDEEIEAAKVIAQKVEDAIVNSGVELARPLTTDEALWMLYRASNPISESNPFAMAERAVVADHLGFSPKAKEADKVGEDDIRFRKYISYQVASAAEAYSDAVAYWGNRMNEAFVDQFDSVDQMMKAIEKATGKKAETWEDVRLILTQTASKGFAKLQEVEQTLIQKMWDAVNAFANEGVSYERLSRYVILKHGLERNELFAKRDARRSYEEEYHSEVKRIKNDPTLTDAEKQQQMDDAKVVLDNHIADINAQTDARYLENRKTDYSGIRAMFADYPGLMSSDNYNTEEEYRTARRKARKLRYKKLDYAEAEAQMECDDFEAGRGALVKDLWDSINNLTKGTLKMQYDYGMLSSETYKNLTGMFKYYVPLRGFSDNTGEDLYDYYSHNTSDGYAPAVIGAKGRKSEAESPFGWMAAMAATAIVSGEKNAAKQALYYFVMNRRANDLLKVADVWYVQSPSDADTYYPEFPPMADPNKTTAENAQQYADWENQMEDLRRQGKAVKKTNRLDIAGVAKFGAREVPEHIIKVNIAGEEKQLILNANPRAAQAINGLLNIEGNPDYQKVLGKILRWMSQVSTGWNPEFWMTNISRDTITAFSAVGIKEDKIYNEAWRKNWVEAWKIVKLLPKLKDGTLGTGRLEDLLREAVENGVQTGYSHIKSMEEWDKDMNKYLKELNKDEAKVVRAIKKGIDKVQTFSESMELVSRFATYLTSRQMGRDIVRSVADAKEVTVNFNRKGSGMRITFDEAKKLKWADGTPIFSEKWKGSQRLKGLLSVAYVSGISALAPFGRKYMMFFNAGIQGVNMWLQMYRKGYGRQVNTLAGAAFALGMLNSIIQGILDGDDNEYQESISDYERRSNLMIGAKGYYVKIALPQELKAFYGLADILYNYGAGNYHHKDTPVEVLKTMTNQLMEIMPINPMGGWQEFIPSFATATIEAGVAIPFLGEPIKGTNKNFAGSPLRDEKPWLSDAERESMPKYAFASNNTWNWLVDLAELANRATGGTKYDAGWLQLDPARIQHYTEQATGGIGGFVGKLTSTINAVFDSEKDVEIANIPFLNKMFTVADERSKNKLTNQQFYYYKGVAEAAEMRYSNYSKEGDKDSRKKERSSDEYKIMKIYYKYDGREEMYRNKLKRARTSTEEKEIKAKRDASRKEFINELADKGLL